MIIGFNKFQNEGRLLLPKMKILVSIGCTASRPNSHGDSYSANSVKEAFIYCKFINKIDTCPDSHAIMKATNAPFSNNPNLKALFLEHVFDYTSQMVRLIIGTLDSYFYELIYPGDKKFWSCVAIGI